MNNNFFKIKSFVGIIVLSTFLFSFLHSELGLLSHEDNDHSAHDYCNIVDDSTPPTIKIIKNKLVILKDFILITPKSVEQNTQVEFANYNNIDDSHFLLNTNKIYLAKNSFLI